MRFFRVEEPPAGLFGFLLELSMIALGLFVLVVMLIIIVDNKYSIGLILFLP